MPLSPKWRFKLNQLRNRWEGWKAGARQTEQALTTEQKMCPSCRALVPRGKATCPYCGQRLKVFGTGPTGKLVRRALPGEVPVTGVLILANLVMFVVEYAAGGTSMLAHLMSGPSMAATVRLGMSLPLSYELATHQYWRWVTACFLHGGLLHIGLNMFALYQIGPMVESLYGGAKFFTLYMLTGIFGYVVSGYFGNASLGASGAIFGLLGLMIAYGVRRSHTAAGQQLRGMAVSWAVFAVAMSFMPGIDIFAHLGGLASGFGLGMVVGDDPPLTEQQIRTWGLIRWAMIAVVAASFYLMATTPVRLG
ncbi:MAG TPA: rhomboid family intramembrane serine protease [Terriglobales bacterium]|nr:rhomboid family intramembrane serine protease [Terriglobales bacterium]